MKLRLSLALAAVVALGPTGCSTTAVNPQAGVPPQSLEIDGLVFTVRPVTDPAELKQTFKFNLLATGVLPIKLRVENRNPTNSFVIARERVVVMSEATRTTNSHGSGDIARDLSTVTRGQQLGAVAALGSPLLFLIVVATPSPGSLINRAAEFNLTGKEFYTRTLSPGQRGEGFVYFRMPKEGASAGPFHVAAQALNPATGQLTPFILKVDLKAP